MISDIRITTNRLAVRHEPLHTPTASFGTLISGDWITFHGNPQEKSLILFLAPDRPPRPAIPAFGQTLHMRDGRAIMSFGRDIHGSWAAGQSTPGGLGSRQRATLRWSSEALDSRPFGNAPCVSD
jgi:hypothetical protein